MRTTKAVCDAARALVDDAAVAPSPAALHVGRARRRMLTSTLVSRDVSSGLSHSELHEADPPTDLAMAVHAYWSASLVSEPARASLPVFDLEESLGAPPVRMDLAFVGGEGRQMKEPNNVWASFYVLALVPRICWQWCAECLPAAW